MCLHSAFFFYSDIIFSPECVKRTISNNEDIVIPFYSNYRELWESRFENPLEDLETFSVNDDYYLQDIGSKPESYDQIQGQYMGIVKFTPKGWNQFIKSVDYSPKPINTTDMTTLLRASIKSGAHIKCIRCSELWLECDNMNDIAVYEHLYGNQL